MYGDTHYSRDSRSQEQNRSSWTDDKLSSPLKHPSLSAAQSALWQTLKDHSSVFLMTTCNHKQVRKNIWLWHDHCGTQISYWDKNSISSFGKKKEKKKNIYIHINKEGGTQQLSPVVFPTEQQKDDFLCWHLHPTREMHRDGGGGRGGKTTEHETQLHLQPNIKHLLFTLEPLEPGPSWPSVVRLKLPSVFDSLRKLSHCRGFGAGIRAGMSLKWTVACNRQVKYSSGSDCPGSSVTAPTLSRDTSTKYSAPCYDNCFPKCIFRAGLVWCCLDLIHVLKQHFSLHGISLKASLHWHPGSIFFF